MDVSRARRDAEAQRYRLQVRLGLIQDKVRQDGLTHLASKAKALRAKVDAVSIKDDEVSTGQARRTLAALEPEVLAAQAEAGVAEHGIPLFPKWVEFTLWTSPVILLMLTLAVVFGLRRRKVEVDQAALDALDAAAESRGGS